MTQGLGMSLEHVLNMEARNHAIAARTPDRAEGVAAFLEKRPPRFTGRAGSNPARA
jgi:2-(1,2-epoxy-1,2-dihydrophenyl)acetyl-CoA isomerase